MTWWGWLILVVLLLSVIFLLVVAVAQATMLESVSTLSEMVEIHKKEGVGGLQRYMQERDWDA